MTRSKLHRGSRGVAHHVPGRTRLKVPKDFRVGQHMTQMEQELTKVPGVHKVSVNHSTGSITVHHDHNREGEVFEAVGKTIGTICNDLLKVLVEEEEASLAGFGLVAAGAGLIGKIAQNIFTSENGDGKATVEDLRNLVPIAFLAGAAYKAYETKSFWSGITPLALTYWAFDTYWRFNVVYPKKAAVPETTNN